MRESATTEDQTQLLIKAELARYDHPSLPLVIEKKGTRYTIGNRRKQFDSDELFVSRAAKLQYIISRDRWKLYWMRADLKWHGYAEYRTLHEALTEIKTDPNNCFWG